MRLIIGMALTFLSAFAFAADRSADGLEAALQEIPGLREFVAQREQSQSRLDDVARDPAGFITQKTYLRSPDAFRGFLKNRAAVDAFLSDRVTTFVTGHGWAVEKLVAPSVVKAVIGSPAMRDRRLVSYFFSRTALPLNLARAPGVKEALHDRAFIEKLLSPETRGWLAANPAAEATLKAQSPVAAELLARR